MRAKKAKILRRIAGGFDLINQCSTVILQSTRKVFVPAGSSQANWEMQTQKVYRVGVVGANYQFYRKLKKMSKSVTERNSLNIFIKNEIAKESRSLKEGVSL